MRKLLILLLLTTGAWAQLTTTVTGTVKDLSNAVVTSGQVTFDLKPAADTTVSGSARFTPSTVICTINGSGLIKALDGVSACVVVQNTSLTPAGTYYKVCIQAYTVTPGSCFNWYALQASFDITTAVPTPGTSPAFTFLDLISSQTISGVKTFTGVPVFSAGISGTASQTLALPTSADTLVGRATTDTLTNKTLTNPVLTTPSIGVATGTSLNLGATGTLSTTAQTGTGSIVMSASPTLTGTVATSAVTASGLVTANLGATVSGGSLTTTRIDYPRQAVTLVNGANNDIALNGASFIKIAGPTGAFSISGFAGGEDGRVLEVFNGTSQAMTITNNATSSAGNRIITLTGADVVLAARTSFATFIYDSASTFWILKSTN